MAQPRDIVMESYGTFERGDMDGFAGLLAEDAELMAPGAALRGRDQVRGYYQVFSDAFSNVHHDYTNVLESGGTVVVEGVGHASHTRPLATPQGDVPPTGRDIDIPFTEIFEVEGDSIRSIRFYFDQVGFMTQLGLMPEPAGA